MPKTIQFKGAPMTLIGRSLKAGDNAPGFRAISADLKEITLSEFKPGIKIITSFLSLDTPVCDLQVKEFNRKAVSFSSGLAVLGISKDLPFAQKRFCGENNINNLTLLSDYKYSSFGINYGLLVKEMNLLARSIFILDKNNTVRYVQIVKELTDAPDYEDALKNLEKVIDNPVVSLKEEVPLKCKPCEGGVPALAKEKIGGLITRSAGWQLVEDPGKADRIIKEFKFRDFVEAKYFLDLVSLIAEEQAHHPVLTLIYNKLKVSLTTHAAGGLTENDFIMAELLNKSYESF
jgi:thiol peroxidase